MLWNDLSHKFLYQGLDSKQSQGLFLLTVKLPSPNFQQQCCSPVVFFCITEKDTFLYFALISFAQSPFVSEVLKVNCLEGKTPFRGKMTLVSQKNGIENTK